MILQNVFTQVFFGKFVQADNPSKIQIGDGTCIGESVWMNTCFQNSSIVIGANALIGRRSVISASGHLGIGSFCVLSPNVYISDVNHKHTDIMLPILDQGVSTRDEVIIEENCWIGINSVVMSSIGRGSTIGANSVVIDVVPPFSLAVGNPATVKRMYNPMTKTWDSISFPEDIKKMLEVRTKVGIPNKLDYHSILCQNSRVKLGLWAAGCT